MCSIFLRGGWFLRRGSKKGLLKRLLEGRSTLSDGTAPLRATLPPMQNQVDSICDMALDGEAEVPCLHMRNEQLDLPMSHYWMIECDWILGLLAFCWVAKCVTG